MKESVVLQFPTIHQLWAFAQAIHVTSMEIQTAGKILICDCHGTDIELAQEKYGAKLLQPTPSV